jgi:hypothetical protein
MGLLGSRLGFFEQRRKGVGEQKGVSGISAHLTTLSTVPFSQGCALRFQLLWMQDWLKWYGVSKTVYVYAVFLIPLGEKTSKIHRTYTFSANLMYVWRDPPT